MKPGFSKLWIVLPLATALLSCSLPKKTNGGGGGGGSTSTLNLLFVAIPPAPPESTSILSFSAAISGITLTPATGTAVNVPINATTYVVEFTRLQSDSAFVASASVPAGTYNSIQVAFSSAVVTFCTQPTPGVAGCSPGSLAQISGAAAQPSVTFSPALTLVANQFTGLALQLNMANAFTISSAQPQVISKVDLAASNVLSVATLPPAKSSLAVNQLDFVEDVTGVVTSANNSAQSLTIQTASRGPITATANSSTVFSPLCATPTFAGCVAQNSTANADLAFNSNGTFTVLEYEPFDSIPDDIIEGVVTSVPVDSTHIQIVTTDFNLATANSLLRGKINIGDPVNVTIALPAGSAGFQIDSKGLFVPANTFQGSTDASAMVPGQTVALLVTAFTAKSGSTPAAATVSGVVLRFSRDSASVSSVSSPFVTLNGFAPYLGIAATAQGEVTSGVTSYDGAIVLTDLNSGDAISVRALYFGTRVTPPFSLAKIRRH